MADNLFEEDQFDAETTLDRLDVLVGGLLEDKLPEDEFHELEALLLESAEARTKYVSLMQLHVDLLDHFQPTNPATPPVKSPVLGFLGDALPPTPGMTQDA